MSGDVEWEGSPAGRQKTVNFNIGVLGHVDSGKTSLCKAVSTIASTAAFDKHPQSKERGITLDLGFSSFTVSVEERRRPELGCDRVQYTLVDCPGHSSLIRTIIGGAQIIDMMLLVVDVMKGMQTQTAECLVIGQITCHTMIIVLNKIDQIPLDRRESVIGKMKRRLLKTVEGTSFKDCPIVPVAARVGGSECSDATPATEEMVSLITEIHRNTFLPKRDPSGPFVFCLDHCFSIRGQGTVLTGTVISGSLAINDMIEIPSMKVQRKVKSMQMFRQPVDRIRQGDRVGLCLTHFDPKHLERGLACRPGALTTVSAFITSAHKIVYFKGTISTKAKYHITVGHETVMGRVTVFGFETSSRQDDATANDLDLSREYAHQEELCLDSAWTSDSSRPGVGANDGLSSETTSGITVKQFILVELEHPVTCAKHSLMIGSRLDTDIHSNTCRLAFHGRIVMLLSDVNYKETILPQLKVFKTKSREGHVERVIDAYSIIGKNLFKKETNIQPFTNLKVTLSTGQHGVIEGGFGQSGKVKVRIPEGLPLDMVQRFSGSRHKARGKPEVAGREEGDGDNSQRLSVKITLSFKRYMFDAKKRMAQ